MSSESSVGRERMALAFAAALTAFGSSRVPSWENILTDPCRLALLASGLTIVLLFVLRFVGPRGLATERITLAAFLAAMPVVYLARWFTIGEGSAGPVWLGVEIVGLVIFCALAILGLSRSLWFLAVGIAAHGVGWDLWHFHSEYIPSWYAIACLLTDIGLGAYVAVRIPAWKRIGTPTGAY